MIDVVAAIIADSGQILACRRRAERDHGGLWEFPGGKVEPGETFREALVREIREELHSDVEVLREFTTVDKGPLRLTFIHAQLEGARPTASTDHDFLRWLSLDELDEVEWAPADRVAAQELATSAGHS